MVLLMGGTVWMGSPKTEDDRGSDEERVQVTLSPFYISKTEVTQAEWQACMHSNPSLEEVEGLPLRGPDLPVQNVSWFDAVAYANCRSTQEGLSPAYTIRGTEVSWDRSADGYRLPTEAEWEYAARGGSDLPWPGVAQEGGICARGNVADASARLRFPSLTTASCTDGYEGLSPVGRFAPNAHGLYDTVGNVWEWSWDRYNPAYAGGKDPIGPSRGELRVVRGGSWNSWPSRTRSADRSGNTPTDAFNVLGFRLVRLAPQLDR